MIERCCDAQSSRGELFEQSIHVVRSELVKGGCYLRICLAAREELTEKTSHEQECAHEEKHQEDDGGHEQPRADPEENVRDIVHCYKICFTDLWGTLPRKSVPSAGGADFSCDEG